MLYVQASFTAFVDLPTATAAGDVYSVVRGCYDEQYAAGMRRLGGTGTGGGQEAVSLSWKVCPFA